MPQTAHPREVVLGVDVGTTSAKVVAFGVDAPWRSAAAREYPLLEPAPGHQVQEPEVVMAGVVEALADVVRQVAPAQVVGIALSTAMHGLIGLDERHRPVTPLVTWADARAAEQARELRRDGSAAGLHDLTGTPVHPMSPLTKLRWFARHEPGTYARVRWWAGLKDFVVLRLTGELVTEMSSASGTGLMHRTTHEWASAALEVAGVSVDRLAPILPPSAVRGLAHEVARQVGLPAGTPVVLGGADGPLGNLGTGATSPGTVGLSLGTSGAVRMVVEEPPERLDPSLFCYALTPTTWAVGGAVSNGGAVVRWAGRALAPDLVDLPGGPTSDERLLELAATAPAGCEGLVVLPYLFAERAPLWDPDVPGAVLGLRRRHSRAHVTRAAVEGVALQLALIAERMDRAVHPVTSVRATGGALRSELWREAVAAAFDRPFVLADAAEGTAVGAAAMGLHALGRAPSPQEAVPMLEDDTPEPVEVRPDAALVEAAARTRELLPQLVADLGAVRDLLDAGS
jgi:gluconokinase